uniref:histidine kinase n=1 Tax=Bosea sp. NBC_00436 TaxID=2969620 RepID=A0A9E7ZS33_9HYPH
MAVTVFLLAITAFTLFVFLRDYAYRAAEDAFDRLLAASALSIAGAVQIENGQAVVELPTASLAMLGFAGENRVFYGVSAPDGRLVTGYDDLGRDLPPARASDPSFSNAAYRGEEVRMVTVGRLVATGEATGWVTIRVAETFGSRHELAAEILSRAALPLLALAIVALVLVWVGVQRAFAPLLALENELRARAPNDLDPVRVPVPAEARQLVGALNDFMARLNAGMRTLSGLVADAAHQVRTPLASLRAQAEIALDEPDVEKLRGRVTRIHENAVRAGQLVSQLLMDATIAHRLEAQSASVVAIDALMTEMRQRIDPDLAERVMVRIAPGATAISVAGDRVALREMLRNLVDNALIHAPDSLVEIEVSLVGPDCVRLAISDRGPGIPDDEKSVVLERFRRGASGEATLGSGLGLSIVRTVVDAHGGHLVFRDRPGGGLTAQVDLPAALPAGSKLAAQTASASAGFVPLLLAFALLIGMSDQARAEQRLSNYPAPGTETRQLVIVGTTDTPLFEPFILDFQKLWPDVAIAYAEMDTLPLYREFTAGTLKPEPDLIVSSAADLQVKLANDGFALRHESSATRALPTWARWRSEVFGFTFEPAVIVYNRDLVPDAEAPRSHLQLAQFLARDTDRWRGLIGTYDIVKSGVGHLLAAQDELISANFWRLANVLGTVGVRLYGGSVDILDLLEQGKLAIGYNVLGSYAFARQAANSRLHVVIPEDYALILTRTILIPRTAAHPDVARAFLDHLLSARGQAIASGATKLGAVMQDVPQGRSVAGVVGAPGVLQPIALGQALLVSLDQQRKSRFLQTWLQIVSGN